jgi:hypothetical protein
MGDILKESAIIFIIGTILLISGCVSPSEISSGTKVPSIASPPTTSSVAVNQPAADFTYQYPPDPSHWIEIDPIRNFQTGSGSSSDRIVFNITGTTNLPVNSLLFIEPYRRNPSSEKEEAALLSNVVIPVENKGGNINTFFYSVNTPAGPGEYRVVVRRWNVTNSTGFTVMGKDPLPWIWIRVYPAGEYHRGKNFTITGTTNLPAGSEIIVTCGFESRFPCPPWAKESPASWSGTACGNDCNTGRFSQMAQVERKADGNNTWMVSADTTGWCANESYHINVQKMGWDNVSADSLDFRFQQE